ncbi:MAG TPA: helix-turn-helix domain-containing protein [Hyphomicrobiales bacterium]|nr:helix-turn-helix domain-containing protein [Hyphomicrobiales bacterium]
MPLREHDHKTVRGLGLFREMSDASFTGLLRGAFLQRFPARVQLITEEEPADFLYVAVEGRVELFASANNRDSTIAIVEPVATFILAAAVKDAVYLMSARTLEACRLLMIPSVNVREAFDQDSAFAQAMAVELATRYREVVKALKNQKLRTGLERLANYLLGQQAKVGLGRFELGMEKATLASYLGMTPENLSRALASLRAYGVEVEGSRVTLGDIKALTTLAKPAPLIDDPST